MLIDVERLAHNGQHYLKDWGPGLDKEESKLCELYAYIHAMISVLDSGCNVMSSCLCDFPIVMDCYLEPSSK